MKTNKKEKKDELGTKINLSAIVKKAEQTKEMEISVDVSKKEIKYYPMPVKVTKSMWEGFRSLYHTLVKSLGDEYIMITRSEVFIHIIQHMDEHLNIDISKHSHLYDDYIGKNGKRSRNERTLPANEQVINCCWANFNAEQLQQWKQVLTKLAVQEGIEKKYDFSKQYFMIDIFNYFENNLEAIAERIRMQKM